MYKTWKLILLFWRPLFIWNLLFSIAGFKGILMYGLGFSGFGLMFKLIGYGSSVYFQHHFSSKTNYYYLNIGYAIWKMYLYIFTADIFFYAIAVSLYFAIERC